MTKSVRSRVFDPVDSPTRVEVHENDDGTFTWDIQDDDGSAVTVHMSHADGRKFANFMLKR